MVAIVSADVSVRHLDEFRQWCLAEWRKVDPFGPDATLEIPAPLLAIQDQSLLGGLAFTRYPAPVTAKPGLWINALIVTPEHRGRGIGSRLVAAAEQEAGRFGATELFVYSNVVRLYQKLGWTVVHDSGENSVLQKRTGNSLHD